MCDHPDHGPPPEPALRSRPHAENRRSWHAHQEAWTGGPDLRERLEQRQDSSARLLRYSRTSKCPCPVLNLGLRSDQPTLSAGALMYWELVTFAPNLRLQASVRSVQSVEEQADLESRRRVGRALCSIRLSTANGVQAGSPLKSRMTDQTWATGASTTAETKTFANAPSPISRRPCRIRSPSAPRAPAAWRCRA